VPCTEGISGINGAKIRALQDILSGIGDQRFVIFSQYARAIYGILPIIHKEYDILVFTGETDWKERASTIERFQDPNSKHRGIMTTTQCGGQSIDLTAASVVIFLDLLWNPQLNYQAVGRVHRAGQTRPVTVINLLAVDTIEDYVQKVLKAKQAMFDQLIPVTRINKIATEYLKQQSSEPTH
jgi:SNF2 family DNA or RNA helicase